MKITNNTLSFNGYKNIITIDRKDYKGNRYSFVAMELTDENEPHLTEYNKINQIMNKKKNNVLSFMYAKSEGDEYLQFGDKTFYLGDTLLAVKKEMSKSDYNKDENIMLKAYSLISKIMADISNRAAVDRDAGFANVIKSSFEMLSKYLGEEPAFHVLNSAVKENKAPNKIAYYLDQRIYKTMLKYFR